MVDINTIVAGVAMFTVVVMALVALIIFARGRLASARAVPLEATAPPARATPAPAGAKLHNTLAAEGVDLSSAWGGGGPRAQ